MDQHIYRAEVEKLGAELEKFAVQDESADNANRCPDRPFPTVGRDDQARSVRRGQNPRSTPVGCRRALTGARRNLESATSADRFTREREELAALTEAALSGMAPLIREEASRLPSIYAEVFRRSGGNRSSRSWEDGEQ